MRRWILLLMLSLAVVSMPASVSAFCGFYVGGATGKLYNNATMVVMMREGENTILSMQNDYSGPTEDFALVIPVPQVLKEENVKTLDRAVFDRIDALAAPRLVEYWEQDPCYRPPRRKYRSRKKSMAMDDMTMEMSSEPEMPRIEAQFSVAEYDIVVLSANDSTGLDIWLKKNNYNIPDGAAPFFQPYVQKGMYFFVAKVDARKVTFDKGKAVLSPLRFNYTDRDFQLPIKLGLINSKGEQDILIHILARDRYETANYPNRFIPTNLNVKFKTKKSFAAFYEGLFREVQKKHPGAVVTEYSWRANGCDPCPAGSSGLTDDDFMTLGGDVIGEDKRFALTLTRLHARYTKDALDDDFVFKKANPVVGGREFYGDDNKLEIGATEAGYNNFQARYIIRHPWKGKIACKNPIRNRWGGPPNGGSGVSTADDLVFVRPRKVDPKSFIKGGKIKGL